MKYYADGTTIFRDKHVNESGAERSPQPVANTDERKYAGTVKPQKREEEEVNEEGRNKRARH